MDTRLKTDVLVLGSGITGCVAALTLAEAGVEVLLITAGQYIDDGNTALAQGGIVYRSESDSPALLEKDILTAGWHHNYLRAVRYLCRKGPEVVKELLIDKFKVPFELNDPGRHYLTREGGHSRARILFCAYYTGRAIMDALIKAIKSHPQIRVLTNRTAIDLLTSHHHSSRLEFKYHLKKQCVGAYVLNAQTNTVETILADFTVLATGGIGQIYLHTTNTASSIGSGLAMAHRAGARIMNVEFVQFHPTALFHRSERKFLISEAVRGEGAKLINNQGKPFMSIYDPRGDLAPRDIVTRAIIEEMLKNGEDCVYLDAASHIKKDLKERFPTIYKNVQKSALILPENQYLLFLRRIIFVEEYLLICTVEQLLTDCMPEENARAQAYTGPIDWQAHPCWKDCYGAIVLARILGKNIARNQS